MLKILLWSYLIGCVCGILGHLLIGLKIAGYCKRKGRKLPKDKGCDKIYGAVKLILMSALPIYHYFMFLVVLFYDDRKIEMMIKTKLDEREDDLI